MSSTCGSAAFPEARTVPTKLQTAPTRWSASRRRASSALTSKSSCWIATRAAAISASCHGREERHFAAVAQRRVVLHHDLVESHAHGEPRRQCLRIRFALAGEFVPQLRERGGLRLPLLGAAPERLAHGSEIAQLDLHARNSDKGRKRTRSPRRIAWLPGLSRRPSAHTVDVSTPELWLGKRSSPPAPLRRTRRNSRRLSGRLQSNCAGSWIAAGCTRVAPCNCSRKGRTSRRKVTKLETGLPGRPMKCALPMLPYANGLPGF